MLAGKQPVVRSTCVGQCASRLSNLTFTYPHFLFRWGERALCLHASGAGILTSLLTFVARVL